MIDWFFAVPTILLEFIVSIAMGLLAWGLAIILFRFIKSVVENRVKASESALDDTLAPPLLSLSKWAINALLACFVLSIFGVDYTVLLAPLGAAAFGAAMALNDVLARDLLASLYIFWSGRIQVGDHLESKNFTGRVMEIGLFSSSLRPTDKHSEKARIIVGNHEIKKSILKRERDTP